MIVTPLPLETIAATGFTHKFKITTADLTGASTTATLRLYPEAGNCAAGITVRAAGYRLITAFDASGDAAINSLLMEVGTNGDPDKFIDGAAAELAADGTEVTHIMENAATTGVTLPYAFATGLEDYIEAKWTVAGGGTPTINELDSGEVEVYLGIFDMNQLAND